MGYDLDEMIELAALPGEEESFKAVYPSPCSVRDILTNYLDLQGELKAGTLRALVAYISDPTQRAWLEGMLQNDHRAELKNLLRLRDLADMLSNELSALKLPLVDLLHILPPIQPRYYTISSSALAQPTTVSITVSLTQGNSHSGRVFTGLCSGYLCRAGHRSLRVFVRASTFRLPKSVSTPLILIGPGTGIAPMYAFLQERRYLLASRPELRNEVGPIALFFGCRNAEGDFLYKEELQDMVNEGVISFLYLAFSRDSVADQDDVNGDAITLAKSKVYVQHLLQLPHVAKRMVSWLKVADNGTTESSPSGAHVYVCGATNMGHDVMTAVQKILTDSGCENAVEAVKRLHDEGRYVQELWTA
jgi:NADPH-ferrihemoprotein reductase